MFKSKFFWLLVLLLPLDAIAATRTWKSSVTSGNWNVASNWVEGSVPTLSDDVIISSNASIYLTASTSVNSIEISGGSTVVISAGSSFTITTTGTANTNGLVINASSTLSLEGSFSVKIQLGGKFAQIYGSLVVKNNSHQILAGTNKVIFYSGASLTHAFGFSGSVFNSLGYVAVFKSGSVFKHQSGPGVFFGADMATFEPGSVYSFENPSGPTTLVLNKTYPILRIPSGQATTSITQGLGTITCDSLQVESALTIGSGIHLSVKGNIYVGTYGNLNYAPTDYAGSKLRFIGTSQQKVYGSGTFLVGNYAQVVIENASGISIEKNLSITDTLRLESGDITTSGTLSAKYANLKQNVIKGSGSFSLLSNGKLFTKHAEGVGNGSNGALQTAAGFSLASGTLVLNGSARQNVGNVVSASGLEIQNVNGVDLTHSISIYTLNFVIGKLFLNSSNLSINSAGSVSGYSTANYIVTNNPSHTSGVVSWYVAGGDRLFPIGTETSYNPVILYNSIGNDIYNVAVKPGFSEAPFNADIMVQREWLIHESVAGGNQLRVRLGWAGGSEGASFERTNTVLMNYKTSSNPNWVSSSIAKSYNNEWGVAYVGTVENINSTLQNATFTIGESGGQVEITPQIIYSSPSQVNVANVQQFTDSHIIHRFQAAVLQANGTLNSISFTTKGTYSSSDIKLEGFKFWYNTTATLTGAIQLGNAQSSQNGTGETIVFENLAKVFSAPGTGYFFFTADINGKAEAGNTIGVNALDFADVVWSKEDESGVLSAGSLQTVIASANPEITVSTTSLTNFGKVITGNASTALGFTVSGTLVKDTITVKAPTHVQVSFSELSGFADSLKIAPDKNGSIEGQPLTLFARFNPIEAVGDVNSFISLSSYSAVTKYISVYGTALSIEPDMASTISMLDSSAVSVDLSFTGGNGTHKLVAITQGSSFTAPIVDGTSYTANAQYGSGSLLDDDVFVAYYGTETALSITGLKPETTYTVAVFEANQGSGNSQNYAAAASTFTFTTGEGDSITMYAIEDFTDGELSSPFWFGDTDVFHVVTNTALPSGGNQDGAYLASDANAYKGSLLTKSNEVSSWQFSLASGSFSPSSTNYVAVILMSDVAFTGAIHEASFNGYFLKIGADGSTDYLELWKSSNASKTKLGDWTVPGNFNYGSLWNGLNLLISRDENGMFDVYFSVGFDYPASPKTSAGSGITDNTFSQSEYFGVSAYFEVVGANKRVFLDNVKFGDAVIKGNAGWRMLSSPKTGFTVSDISDNTAIQGISGGDYENSTSNVFTYTSEGSWQAPSGITSPIASGYGFITKFFNNDLAGSKYLPIVIDVDGNEPESETTEVLLNHTNSINGSYYTLLGNPYSKPFRLDYLTSTESLNAYVQIWNNEISDYENVLAEQAIIKPWQGFWVSVDAFVDNQTASFSKAGKTNQSPTISLFKQQPEVKGAFSITANAKKSTPAILRIAESASIEKDRFDAVKMIPLSDTYAIIGIKRNFTESLLAIESIPDVLETEYEAYLNIFTKGISGEMELSWDGFKEFPATYTLALHDSKTGEIYDLREVGSIVIEVEQNQKAVLDNQPNGIVQQAQVEQRFKVSITPISTSTEKDETGPSVFALLQNYPNPFNPSTEIGYSVPNSAQVKLTVYDLLGRTVQVLVNETKSQGVYSVKMDASGLSSGVYVYRLESAGKIITKKMTLIK
ncbi:T9SS type A sorting domain-containing protein [bacterium]|nr:MAG: T9SS type A sorting domain-containing protein [bacterium]